MKLSMNWLNKLIKIDADNKSFIADMTMSGSKVETIDYLGAEIENVVVGKINDIARHPDADKLVVCQVDVGENVRQIVTGASNVKVGDLVPVALDGAKLPGGVEIKNGMLRGVPSFGMLCSHQELGLTDHDIPNAPEHGILLLNEMEDLPELTLGMDIRKVLGFDDYVVDFEITPNRPDCLSVIGLAREAAATYGMKFTPETPVVKGGAGDVKKELSVTIEDRDLCPRYSARIVKNVKIAPSPKWMRDSLRASGVRPINNIVDITNYVMLEYGQPLHSFDKACLRDNSIVVRRARKGETLDTLDDQPRALDESMLVIADGSRPVAVAGVMGGANSEITDKTTDVVFESANFSGVSVRLTAKKLGMRTESSARFEKGLDAQNVIGAVNRACELCELLGAGEVYDGIIDVDYTDKTPRILKLEPERINSFIGIDVSREQMVKYFENLGFGVNGDDLTVPSWRADVEQFADVAEEVARFYGYNNIPTTVYAGATEYRATPKISFEDELKRICAGLGYSEALTYSFISPKGYDRVGIASDSPLRNSMVISNPLSDEMSTMRTTVLPSIVEVLARNYNVKNRDVRIYELGKVYTPCMNGSEIDYTKLPYERKILTFGAFGNIDFFGMKGVVEMAASALHINGLTYTADKDNPSYHPGRCAKVWLGDKFLGTVGQIHPAVMDGYSVDAPVYVAEIECDVLFDNYEKITLYKQLPKFPAVERDIAAVCDESVTAADFEACIREGVGELLDHVTLFDVYRGAQVGEGKKSMAYSIFMRAADRTLTDADADGAMSRTVELLRSKLGAILRG